MHHPKTPKKSKNIYIDEEIHTFFKENPEYKIAYVAQKLLKEWIKQQKKLR